MKLGACRVTEMCVLKCLRDSQRLCWWTSWSHWGRCRLPASRRSCLSAVPPPGWEWSQGGSSLPASSPDRPACEQRSKTAQHTGISKRRFGGTFTATGKNKHCWQSPTREHKNRVSLQSSKQYYRSLVRAGGSQEAQQKSEEGGEDLSQSSGGVGHHNLPHVEGSLSNHQLSVWTAHVEAREDAITPLSAKSSNDSLGEIKSKVIDPLHLCL